MRGWEPVMRWLKRGSEGIFFILHNIFDRVPDPPHILTHPTSCSLSVSEKLNNNKTPRKLKKKLKIRKHKKTTKQGIHWPAAPGRHGVWSALRRGWCTQGHAIGENWFSLSLRYLCK